MQIEKKVLASKKGDVTLVKLTNSTGASVVVSSLGCGIVSIVVPDKNGNMQDVALGYNDIDSYYYDGPCAGKVPGRYANRIAKGNLIIDGVKYQLNINNGPNALHGGPEGFQNQIWHCDVEKDKVIFSRRSEDGEENYPGNLDAKVEYMWNEANELRIEMSATTDKTTVVNLTNHTYFNLAGENSGSVLDEKLWLGCSKYLPTDESLIPTGEMASVEGTPMDFTTPKALGQDIKKQFPALIYGKGYDNCWVVNDWKKDVLNHVATLTDEKSGRALDVTTTQPAVQVYTGNWLAGCPESKSNRKYEDYDGVAIECQGMPDAPNKANFPSQLLKPGELYQQTIIFKFYIL